MYPTTATAKQGYTETPKKSVNQPAHAFIHEKVCVRPSVRFGVSYVLILRKYDVDDNRAEDDIAVDDVSDGGDGKTMLNVNELSCNQPCHVCKTHINQSE